jgi:hypothetical protein
MVNWTALPVDVVYHAVSAALPQSFTVPVFTAVNAAPPPVYHAIAWLPAGIVVVTVLPDTVTVIKLLLVTSVHVPRVEAP